MARNLPPIRIVDDARTASDLRALLDNARRDLPDQLDVTQFHGRIEAAIAAGKPIPNLDWGSTSGAASATAGKGLSLVTGLVGGGLILSGLLAVGIGLELRGKGTSIEVASGMAPAVSSAVPSLALDAPTQEATPQQPGAPADEPNQRATATHPASTLDAPLKSPTISNARATAQAPSSPPSEAIRPAASATPPVPTEASLLTQARAALANHPDRALALTQEHAQRFPNGALAQEREVIAIAALRALGRTDAANQRGSSFEQKYPGSAHRSKVEQVLKGRAP